jgi:hypothetical protein
MRGIIRPLSVSFIYLIKLKINKMENKKVTAVEWLVEQMSNKNYGAKVYFNANVEIIEKAKEMEKQQIIEAHNNGKNILPPNESAEQYYKETFGKSVGYKL